MAELMGNLWELNLVRVVFIDVSDDYRLMQPPLPSDYYPVVQERWMPRYGLDKWISNSLDLSGFLYDWHESPAFEGESWYVGVVDEQLANQLLSA